MRERWREWWQARNTRERGLITGGGGALAVALLWAYVWVPLEADRFRLTATLPTLRTQAQQLALQAGEVERLRASARKGAAPSQSAIEDTLKSAGLGGGVVNIAMLGGGRVQVDLGVVPFDTLVGVIAQLAESHGLAVETFALKAVGEPGKVRVETLVLQGARSS
jgi:general secretion pathway protein M